MRVPLCDVNAQNGPLREELLAAMARVLDRGEFILGAEVEAFEAELARVVGTRRTIAVSSGTDALLVSLMALDVRPGDEVVTTPYSFFATAGVIARLGARPVFVDIEEDSFNADPSALRSALSDRTRAVILVHLFGRPATPVELPVPLVEDAAQAIAAGPLRGRLGCLSFFPSKNLGGFGDGGAVYVEDEGVADRVRLLRTHGGRGKYLHQEVGGNFRLDALQAAVLRVKLPHLAAWSAARRANAERYRGLFAAAAVPPELRLPSDAAGHIYNQFVVRAPRRDALRDHLTRNGIGSAIYYPLPLHRQPCFAHLGYQEGSFPRAEAAARETLALPIYPELTPGQQALVVNEVARFYRG